MAVITVVVPKQCPSRTLQKLPALVRGFFTDPHLRYVTA
jgi:hypothetical protein